MICVADVVSLIGTLMVAEVGWFVCVFYEVVSVVSCTVVRGALVIWCCECKLYGVLTVAVIMCCDLW